MISNDPSFAAYGLTHIEVAIECLVVQTLLITDDSFRNSDMTLRKTYESLVNSMKDSGGSVHVFSSMHVYIWRAANTNKWNRSNSSFSSSARS